MKKFTIVGIGEILWDEFPDGKRLGGAPANFAFHAGQLGTKSIVISRTGDDDAGREIKALLDQKKMRHLISTDSIHPTGKVSVKTDHTGSPHYVIHENAAWDFIPYDSEAEAIAYSADAVCYGTLAQRNTVSARSIQHFIRATKKNCLKIYDINLRQHYYSEALISDLMRLANILKLNQDELDTIAEMFLSCKKETEQLDELKSIFCLDMIVLTKGKEGSCLFKSSRDTSIYQPESIQVTDSVGAGDSFTAAVAFGVLNGFPLNRINKMASTIASYVCSQKGATPIIPPEIMNSYISEKVQLKNQNNSC